MGALRNSLSGLMRGEFRFECCLGIYLIFHFWSFLWSNEIKQLQFFETIGKIHPIILSRSEHGWKSTSQTSSANRIDPNESQKNLIANSRFPRLDFRQHSVSISGSGSVVKTFMKEIPDEILDQILFFVVRGHVDMRTISLTCKRWRFFANQDSAWKRLAVRGWGNRADIVQMPIEKDPSISWNKYYQSRILSHLPSISYMKIQQHMTVSIRYFHSNIQIFKSVH